MLNVDFRPAAFAQAPFATDRTGRRSEIAFDFKPLAPARSRLRAPASTRARALMLENALETRREAQPAARSVPELAELPVPRPEQDVGPEGGFDLVSEPVARARPQEPVAVI